MRHKSIIGLSHDHHHGLVLAQLIKKNAPHYQNLPNDADGKISYTINAYEKELLPHFKKEEEYLFPVVKGKSDKTDQLIDDLLNEHKLITSLVLRLQSDNDKEALLNELGNVLANHIRKEERELFAMLEDILTEEELNVLVTQLT
ncbi:MAG: hemerythrin domain-containing protein [Ignavibacteriales bacterium]|nr:MAG: hemerythrin domain-containing protein [Ignavibacteriales bacterium]